jgi:hypothetical protein
MEEIGHEKNIVVYRCHCSARIDFVRPNPSTGFPGFERPLPRKNRRERLRDICTDCSIPGVTEWSVTFRPMERNITYQFSQTLPSIMSKIIREMTNPEPAAFGGILFSRIL